MNWYNAYNASRWTEDTIGKSGIPIYLKHYSPSTLIETKDSDVHLFTFSMASNLSFPTSQSSRPPLQCSSMKLRSTTDVQRSRILTSTVRKQQIDTVWRSRSWPRIETILRSSMTLSFLETW